MSTVSTAIVTDSIDMAASCSQPILRIRSVCTSTDLAEDTWMFCDLLLFRQLTERTPDELWMAPIDMSTSQRTELKAHGHPRAERVRILDEDIEDWSWIQAVDKGNLKTIFLDSIRSAFSEASPGDHVLIIITGHGLDEFNETCGYIEFGEVDGELVHMSPEEIMSLISHPEVKTTLIVNSCFSGNWVSAKEKFTPSANLAIVARSDEFQEILSFPKDVENRNCGGWFANFLTGEFYQELGLLLPRPSVLDQYAQAYIEHFPKSNIADADVSPSRTTARSFPVIVESIKTDLEVISTVLPQPCATLDS